jgi:putative selenate reductase
MSDNVTLSTMHGCPPEEIGSIISYLLKERGLHAGVKLNPTLLGAEQVRTIVNQQLGFGDLAVSDEVFSQDLGYNDALSLLRELQSTAADQQLDFWVKLTNTLPVNNHGRVFDSGEPTVYLSGRPLHAVTIQLAHRLTEDFAAPLAMSFSGGADANNIAALMKVGMRTVTVCSDLLRPGGYLRLGQYLENLASAMRAENSSTLDEFVCSGLTESSVSKHDAARQHLMAYAASVIANPLYHKESYDRSHTKTERGLDLFDCIQAPCTDACDVDQKVPNYMRLVRAGNIEGAAEITRKDNPLPSILGRACHHPCEPVCLRTHIDQPLAIREIKRFITENESPATTPPPPSSAAASIAVVGAGPCGLSAASFLARAGHAVVVFEAGSSSGGMVSGTIPDYRAAGHSVARDLDHIRGLGIEVRHNQEMGRDFSLKSLRRRGFKHVVIAVGARQGLRLDIQGEDSLGVHDGLDFLRAARSGEPPPLGAKIGVIGGGDVAMDCARTARRLGTGEVTVFYRRTKAEMPAQKEEVQALLAEGIDLVELTAPKHIHAKEGRLSAMTMTPMHLGRPDSSGRRRPIPDPDAEIEISVDSLIVAIGQRPDLTFLDGTEVNLTQSGYLAVDPQTLETSLPGVFAGGDIIGDGPASIVEACGDGRRIADAIDARLRLRAPPAVDDPAAWPEFGIADLLRRRARHERRIETPHLPVADRAGFAEVVLDLTHEDAAREAARCLDCDLMCSTCDSVCPNLAIFTYRSRPGILRVPRLRMDQGALRIGSETLFRVDQGHQVAVLTDLCNECGNCVTFCPASGRPWLDKPRLFLNRQEFEAQTENAFMLITAGESSGIQARFESQTHELFEDCNFLRYSSPSLQLVFDSKQLTLISAECGYEPAKGELVLAPRVGTMVTLLRSITDSMPEIPVVEADPTWLLHPFPAE